jgi:hypothetical protein
MARRRRAAGFGGMQRRRKKSQTKSFSHPLGAPGPTLTLNGASAPSDRRDEWYPHALISHSACKRGFFLPAHPTRGVMPTHRPRREAERPRRQARASAHPPARVATLAPPARVASSAQPVGRPGSATRAEQAALPMPVAPVSRGSHRANSSRPAWLARRTLASNASAAHARSNCRRARRPRAAQSS